MKILKPTLFFALITIFSFAQSWYVVDTPSINGTPDFSDVFFNDDDTGWITSSSHANIFRTDDGANTFSTQTTQYTTEAVCAIDGTYCYSGGANGRVYYTTDGGINWPAIGSISVTLADIDFATTTQGYACGNAGAVYSVTTQGVINLNSGLSTFLTGISSPSVDNVWVCGGSTISYYNGATFTFQSGPAGTYNSIFFINDQEGWVVGNNGIIGHTVNGGNTWIQQTNSYGSSLYRVFFLNQSEGWAVGAQGTILYTDNGGDTWSIVGAGLTTEFLRGIHFSSPNNGYVVGNGKTLIKYGLPLATKDENSIPQSFELKQNFPNPFNPITTIEFSLKEENTVILKIYDMGGNEVATILNDKLQSGSHSIKLGVETLHVENPAYRGATYLQSGIYFYKLQVGDEVQTRKMVVLK